jgi:hypothetical protein
MLPGVGTPFFRKWIRILLPLPNPCPADLCPLCGVMIEVPVVAAQKMDGPFEPFGRLNGRVVHADCLGQWKYRDAFVTAWNRELEKIYQNKYLMVTPVGEVVNGHPGPWRLTPEEEKRLAQDKLAPHRWMSESEVTESYRIRHQEL